jgi:hypothetical protein
MLLLLLSYELLYEDRGQSHGGGDGRVESRVESRSRLVAAIQRRREFRSNEQINTQTSNSNGTRFARFFCFSVFGQC